MPAVARHISAAPQARARQTNINALATGAKAYMVPKAIKPRIRKAITLMVFGALNRPEAAAKVGISDDWLYQQLKRPEVMKHYAIECEVLRTGQRHKNIHTAIAIRDMGKSDKVAIDAMRFLEKDYDSENATNVRVGVQINVQPGYICDVSKVANRSKQLLELGGPMNKSHEDQ